MKAAGLLVGREMTKKGPGSNEWRRTGDFTQPPFRSQKLRFFKT